jgi:hypothetical protein
MFFFCVWCDALLALVPYFLGGPGSWRNIAITLICSQKSEEKAHAYANA